jgi:hypothetical protein
MADEDPEFMIDSECRSPEPRLMPQPVLSAPVPVALLSPLAHPVAEDRPLDSRLFDSEGVDMSDMPWIGTCSPTEDVGAG